MTPELSCLHLARFTLQAETAFSINSGLSDQTFDSLLVRDANGLPTIPGTSLAGVLRHQISAYVPTKEEQLIVQRLFGYANPDDTGQMSRVQISWGCIHDSYDQPIEGRLEQLNDTLLDRLAQDHPYHRERVRINHKGVAQKGAKFDVTVIPKGCRFSFELSYWAEEIQNLEADTDWSLILKLLHKPIRLGSNIRSGLGCFKFIALYTDQFDFKTADYKRYSNLKPDLADTQQLKQQLIDSNPTDAIEVTLNLIPEDFWRFGQVGEPLKPSIKKPDVVPMIEPIINWKGHKASIEKGIVIIPGSSVKGALAHRVQFHYNCILLQNSDNPVETHKQLLDDARNDQTIENILFGFARDNDENNKTSGQAGLLFCNDVYCDDLEKNSNDVAHFTHNSLDRFTGGTRNKVLYMEELIWKKAFSFKICIDEARAKQFEQQNPEKMAHYKQALQATLEDLVSGRLSLGAGASKGHGYFNCENSQAIQWSKPGLQWIGEKQ